MGIKPEQFRWIAGENEAGRYGFHPDTKNAHVFCRTCGVRIGTTGFVAEIGGAYWSVALSTLDDLPVQMLIDAPVRYMNGRDNDWFHAPSETSQL